MDRHRLATVVSLLRGTKEPHAYWRVSRAARSTMADATSPGDAEQADGKGDVAGGDAAMIAAGAVYIYVNI